MGKAAAVPAAAATPLLDATPDIPQSQNHAAQATGDTEAIADGDQASIGVSQASTTANGSKELSTPQIPSVEDQMDIPRPSIEVSTSSVFDSLFLTCLIGCKWGGSNPTGQYH